MKRTPPHNDNRRDITRCSHDGDRCDALAWSFWKAQRQLVALNLRLAHVKKQLSDERKKTPVSPDDRDDC